MLSKLISIYVIEEIFLNDCKGRITASEKMLYINCLMHNFKTKEISLPNLNDFIVIKASIPNHDKFSKSFNSLCNANLITDELHSYKFLSHWIKYMELSKINSHQEFGNSKVDLSRIESEFYSSEQLIELCQMKFSLNKSQIQNLMSQFLKEQIVSDKTYYNLGEAKKHFIYWCANNKDKAKSETLVKSNSKILGL